MQQDQTHSQETEQLLARFECRAAVPAGKAEREAALAFGAELNRLQGHQPSSLDWRLRRLRVSGRVDREEYIQLINEIAKAEERAKASRRH